MASGEPYASAASAHVAQAGKQPVDWVNPFIGTTYPHPFGKHPTWGLRWTHFPGPSMPFGMVKLSPDNLSDTPGRAGYNYNLGTLLGFSHIHSWTMSGLLMMPTTGQLKVVQGPEAGSPESFRSHFRHETEKASPGYYAVTLDDYNIRAELTATTRAGFQRYTFPKADQARILIALQVPAEDQTVVKDATVRKVSNTEIEGESYQAPSSGSGDEFQVYKLYFVVRFSKPFDSMGGWVGTKISPDTEQIAGHGDVGVFANYHTSPGEVIEVKSGISLVSIEQARLNLDTETNRFGWDFDAARKNARDTWNNLLKSVQVEGGTEADRTKFYTNLYRSYVARSIFSDVNGKYVDPSGRVQQLEHPEYPMLGSDAFWNTFWDLNQLWGLVTPDVMSQWVNSQLKLYETGGWLSKGPALRYSGVMDAEPEIAMLVGAWQKGIRNFDGEEAFAAIKHQLTTPGMNYYKDINQGWVGLEKLEPYRDLGYVPVEDGQVSMTLEYAYDDWCAAQLAKALGKMDDYQYFSKRAQNYRNIWDPSVGYFRPKHRNGRWAEPFSLSDNSPQNFTEGSAWQYSFWVPHDMKGLIGLMGRDRFVQRLNEGFEKSRPDYSDDEQYVNVGNQPNMEAPWLFNYAGAPWLTQKWTREVMEHSYHNAPAGYTDDEDQGQLGSYFVMTAMGLFEMDGGCSLKPIYEIGSPLFNRIVIHLDRNYYPGHQFVIEAKNNSPKNVYIQSATLNGETLNKPWIYHSDVVKGGKLVLVMGPEANKKWGSAPEAAPPQNVQ